MARLPAYLEDQTEDSIMRRMMNRVPPDIDVTEGSFIWDSLSPVAFVLSEASIWAQEVLRRAFASTTFGEYLDLRCAEHGVSRRLAVKATGQVKFIGTPGIIIPAGTVVATPADEISGESSIEFETKSAITLDSNGEAIASIQALEAGKLGNVLAGVITVLATPISGVTSVENPTETTGGTDVESDESLLERYLVRVRTPSSSGNKADYVNWSMEVAGVGGVQVHPLWNGPGTVRVVLLDAAKRAASQDIVDQVAGHIDSVRPIGADVTVQAAEEVPINISVKLVLASNTTIGEVKELIESGTREYLKQLAFVDPLVRYTRIAAILLDIPPIIDFADLTVNGNSNTNIEMQPGQVGVLGTVTVYE
ncbi:baseplate J/gp47 family protein [Paenibacillus sp. MSJ-34]|uniref:baseplate J/gp47 family protein n=1 Tax=Paenibacillus sp. MSJ-34 TaxID=2841529 RepID=UPI001C10CD54|nr:baseplate J/gp47 family protein [Paenibacillus sp. MSJ-34]MBU5441201.1 baseplate J/gp47 family protein [Paenibacillus sp. MSJ-34]